jgi:hypothetical protein
MHAVGIHSVYHAGHAMLFVDLRLGQREHQDLVVIEALRRLEVQDRTLHAALLVLASRDADGVANLPNNSQAGHARAV